MTENELNLIPYFTRLIIVDRVGFEPTTSAHNVLYFVVQSALDEGKLVQIQQSISLSSFIYIYFDNLVSSTSYVIIFMSISITYERSTLFIYM
jgi:hypothetical protein